MITTFTLANSASTTTWRMPGTLVAPQSARLTGSESAYTTLGNPVHGADIVGVSRVRDAKQAAPPRGELH